MNLLVVSPWYPCPPDNGSRLRAFHLLQKWSQAGHKIRLVTGLQEDIADRADAKELATICDTAQVFPWKWHDGRTVDSVSALLSPVPRSILETDNPPMRAAILEEFARKPDACIAMEMAAAPLIPAVRYGIPTILEQVEVTGVKRKVQGAQGIKARLAATLTKAKHNHYWRQELCRFDAVTVVSEEEAVDIRELVGENPLPIVVVPNGVDTNYYSMCMRSPVAGRILYNGAMTYGPNRDAVAWFVREILPLIAQRVSDAHLFVTGRVPADVEALFQGESRIHLTGFVPDMRPVLAEAAVCAVPLMTGGGTRLKILEAWAAEVPVVSTSVGAVGLAGATEGKHLLIADSAGTFADACVQALTEPNRIREMALNARRLVEERYDWRSLANQVLDIVELLKRK